MTEANNVWRVEVDGKEHEIELDHTLMDKRTIMLDGEVIEESRRWSFKEKPYEFEIAGRPAKLEVHAKYGGMAWGSEFHFDGRYVEPLR